MNYPKHVVKMLFMQCLFAFIQIYKKNSVYIDVSLWAFGSPTKKILVAILPANQLLIVYWKFQSEPCTQSIWKSIGSKNCIYKLGCQVLTYVESLRIKNSNKMKCWFLYSFTNILIKSVHISAFLCLDTVNKFGFHFSQFCNYCLQVTL